jgi:hypothetical protein
VQRQSVFGEPLMQNLEHLLRILLVFETKDPSSSGGEFHPSALTEPDGSLSTHPALTIQHRV